MLAGLLRATHPLPAAAVTALVGVVTAARGADAFTLALVVASTGAGQASVGWSNDYLDRSRDARAGRVEKPLVAGAVRPAVVWRAALVAAPLSIVLSAAIGPVEAAVMAVAVGAAWAYNAGVKDTVASAVPYAVAFGLAPVYIWQATSGGWPPGWVAAAAALLGTAAHLLNALPDLELDRAQGKTGLVHRLGPRPSLLIAGAVLSALLAVVLIADGAPVGRGQGVAAALAAASIASVMWAGARGWARLAFRLTILAAAAIVATFLLSPAPL